MTLNFFFEGGRGEEIYSCIAILSNDEGVISLLKTERTREKSIDREQPTYDSENVSVQNFSNKNNNDSTSNKRTETSKIYPPRGFFTNLPSWQDLEQEFIDENGV